MILSGDQLYRMDYMDLVQVLDQFLLLKLNISINFDHLNMILILFDYHLQNHIDRNSDITVSCVPVGERYAVTSIFGGECPFLNKLRFSFLIRNFRLFLHIMAFLSRASDYGLMKIDSRGRVIQFWEKPKETELEAMVGQPIHEMLSNVLCVSCLYN